MDVMINRWTALWRRTGWSGRVRLASVALLCLGAYGFIDLADTAGEGTPLEMETKLMLALRNPDNLAEPIGPWWLQELGRDLSALGSAVVVIIFSLLVIGYLLLRRRYGCVVLIVITVGGGYALSHGLKNVFDRVRPDVVPHLSEVRSASFPSGHAMVSSLVYLTLGALLAQAAERRREKVYFILGAFLLTFLIGASRVFLGVHYPSDVLAGWCAGTAWMLLCWLIADFVFEKRPAAARG